MHFILDGCAQNSDMTVESDLTSTEGIEKIDDYDYTKHMDDSQCHSDGPKAEPGELLDQDYLSTNAYGTEDFINDDFCFVKVQCDNLRASLRREKICRQEVETENEKILSELKALAEKHEADLQAHSEIKEKLYQELLTKQHKINRLILELKEVTEAFDQRNKRLEELRRTEQYWKGEVTSLRNEILHKSKEALIFCSEIDRLKDELKWRNSLLKKCCCQNILVENLSFDGHEIQICQTSFVPSPEEEKCPDGTFKENLIKKEQNGNEMLKIKVDEHDGKHSMKNVDEPSPDNVENSKFQVPPEDEMQELNCGDSAEKEENFHLLDRKNKEKQELCQKIIDLENLVNKLESEKHKLKEERKKDHKLFEMERKRTATLQQCIEYLKQSKKKIIIRRKQKEKEQRKKMEDILQRHCAVKQELFSELNKLRLRIKELLLQNSSLKTSITDKEEIMSVVKLENVKVKELLKTEVYINDILCQRNRVIQDELSLSLNTLNRSIGSSLYKNTCSPALGDFLKEWRVRMQETVDTQTTLFICNADKETSSVCPFTACNTPSAKNNSIKSCAQKSAELLRLELFEVENSWLHKLLEHLQRKWSSNINCFKPVPVEDVCEEISHSCLRAKTLLATLDQGGILPIFHSGDFSSISNGVHCDTESTYKESNTLMLQQDSSEDTI